MFCVGWRSRAAACAAARAVASHVPCRFQRQASGTPRDRRRGGLHFLGARFSSGVPVRQPVRVRTPSSASSCLLGRLVLWASRRRLFKPARMPKSDAPTDARVKWGRMLLDAREARKCYKMLDKFSPFFYTSATSRVCARSNQLVANSRPAVSSSRPAVFQQFFGTFWHFRSS